LQDDDQNMPVSQYTHPAKQQQLS